mmetsp:Transcript_39233/g.79993  ORF Transcript_39233/g.79993 Transcript_39233/m.79993 type:complete len:86 (+) Transcript_39233:1028-1285(+)
MDTLSPVARRKYVKESRSVTDANNPPPRCGFRFGSKGTAGEGTRREVLFVAQKSLSENVNYCLYTWGVKKDDAEDEVGLRRERGR